jgi:8-oxo-dGTP pyrophosphatase MutT (NUDIX family)
VSRAAFADFQQQLAAYPSTDVRDRQAVARMSAFVASQPQAFGRDPQTSHVTGSAVIVDQERQHLLLTHHRKLDIWVQLGGHCDGIADPRFVAQKEAYEESGLPWLRLLSPQIFDLDIHDIPARRQDAAHEHYDVRYLFEADRADPFAVSAESKDLAWVPLDRLEDFTREESVLVFRRKLRAGGL